MKRFLSLQTLLLLFTFSSVPLWAENISPITALAFSPDGTHLAVGMRRDVTILDVATGKETMHLKGSPGSVTGLAYRPDGKVLAGAGGLTGRMGEIRLWNLSTQKSTVLQPHSDVTYGIAYQKGGKRLVTGSYDHLVSISTLDGKPQYQILKDHTDAVYGIAFSPDGTRIASVAGDRTLKIWNASTGKRVFTLSESTAELYSVAFRPDGKQICAGGADKTLRTWNLTPTAGTLTKSAFAHQAAILHVAYTPDGKSIVTGGEDNAVKRWDATTLAEEQVYGTSNEVPQSLAINPKGSLLAVGRHDGSVTIFDLKSARLVQEPLKGTTLAWVRRYRMCLQQQQQTNELKEKQVGGATLFLASVSSLFPTGIQRGATREFTLYGANINATSLIAFDDPEIRATLNAKQGANAGTLAFRMNCGANARLGIHRLRLQTPNGITGSIGFSVEEASEIGQQEPNETLQTAQKISLPATLVGGIDKPGDIDYYRFEAQAGEEIVFDAVTQAIRSRVQPILALLDSTGKTLAESRPRSGKRDVAVGYRFVQRGEYVLRVSDFENQSGGDVYYRILAGTFPYIERLFPLAISKGATSQVELTGFNLGAKRSVSVTPPPKGSGATSLNWAGEDGKLENVRGATRIDLDDSPAYLSTFDALERATAPKLDLPVLVQGRLWNPKTKGGISHYYRFRANQGQKVVLETVARRRGSALDSSIEVLDSAGKPVERAVLRAVGQTEMVLNDRDSLSSGLRLFNWDGFQMGDYMMVGREVIQIYNLPKGPDDDVQFRNFRGRRTTFFGTTPEFHSLGSAAYKVEVHRAGSKFSSNGYPLTRLYYQNDDGGVLYDRDSWLEFVAPKDGEYTVRLTDTRGLQGEEFTYALQIRSPRPSFRVNVSTMYPNIPSGDADLITVEAERYDGFSGAIDLTFVTPKYFWATSGRIEEGENSATLRIGDSVGKGRAMQEQPNELRATAVIDGKEEKQTLYADMPRLTWNTVGNTDLKVTTDKSEVVLRPNGEAIIEVRVQRFGKYGKRTPIDVRNLPYGVRVQDVGLNGVLVNEEESTRKFVLYCEPWVKPQERLFYVSAVVEGGVNSVAMPLTLRITSGSGVTTIKNSAGKK